MFDSSGGGVCVFDTMPSWPSRLNWFAGAGAGAGAGGKRAAAGGWAAPAGAASW